MEFKVWSLFVRSLSQNIASFDSSGDVIHSKLGQKNPNLCTNGDRKMTIKSKRRFQVKCLFMKLFSRNLEIQVPYCDFVISKLGQRDSICISCTTGGKNIKIRTYNNLVNSKKNF